MRLDALENMHEFYIKLACLKKKRRRKLVEDISVGDYDLTEISLLSQWEGVFGEGSKVIAKLIYIFASN